MRRYQRGFAWGASAMASSITDSGPAMQHVLVFLRGCRVSAQGLPGCLPMPNPTPEYRRKSLARKRLGYKQNGNGKPSPKPTGRVRWERSLPRMFVGRIRSRRTPPAGLGSRKKQGGNPLPARTLSRGPARRPDLALVLQGQAISSRPLSKDMPAGSSTSNAATGRSRRSPCRPPGPTVSR